MRYRSFLLAGVLIATAAPGIARADEPGSLFPRAALPTMRSPHEAVLADLDGDGIQDLVSRVGAEGVSITHGVSVMLGRPEGGFAPARRTPTAQVPSDLQVVDADDDEDLDALATLPDGSALLLRNEAGVLAEPIDAGLGRVDAVAVGRFLPGGPPMAVAITDQGLRRFRWSDGAFVPDGLLDAEAASDLLTIDLEGDGVDEVVVADPARVSIYRELALERSIPLAYTTSLERSDATGDGRPEILVVTAAGEALALDAGLATVRSAPSPQAVALTAGDLDADGIPEMVRANASATLTIAWGDGGPPTVVGTARPATDVLVADAGGDGHADLLAVEPDSSVVEVIEGSGTRSFPPLRRTVATSYAATDMDAGDFNGDGSPDFVSSDIELGLPNLHGAYVHLGDGSGGFTRGAELLTDGQPGGIAVGDVNGDGNDDVLIADFQLGLNQYLGLGDGSFLPRTVVLPCRLGMAVAAADFNEDGYDDAAVVCRSSFYPGYVTVLHGSPAGLGAVRQTLAATGTGDSFTIETGDLNGDGALDLVIGYVNDSLVYHLGGTAGIFGLAQTGAVGDHFSEIAVGDLTGDGKDDVVAPLTLLGEVEIVPGTAAGLGTPFRVPSYEHPLEAAVADLDGDGAQDLVMGHGPNAISVTTGISAGPGTPRASTAQGAIWGDLAVTDVNRDGRPDVLGAAADRVEVFLQA